MFTNIYQSLKQTYQQSWLKFLFWNTSLAKLIAQKQGPSAFEFFNTYLSSWWWNQRWFKSCIESSEAKHQFDSILESLQYLKDKGIFTEYSCLVVANLASPFYLGRALSYLQEAGILTEANFSLIANHANFDELTYALSYLQEAKILTEANFTLVANHAYPNSLARTLFALQQAGILTDANRTLVANHDNSLDLTHILSALQRAGILTQTNFNILVTLNHTALASLIARQLIWHRIPRHLVTQANFERLVTAAEEATPMAALERVANQILCIQAQAGHAAVFNPSQSTHTASVHRSVSESASRLMASYGAGLELEAKIKEIKTYVMGLDESPKHDAAKRCIARITEADYTFTDSSNVSTRQLLALAWAAIHDETKCKGALEDAKALFVEGLYEIQRGYNLDDLGNDLGGEDRPICLAGTFNKLMEKLNGIHSSVEVYYITHEGLGIKFPKVVAAHALNYLNRLSNPETATAYLSMKALLDSIKENGLGPIWDNIKSAVRAILWDEFKEAYANHPEHPQFSAMIDNGHESNAPDLTELYAALEASPGHQAFEESNPCLGLPPHSLWANRHESPVAQNAFDRQYSLVLKP